MFPQELKSLGGNNMKDKFDTFLEILLAEYSSINFVDDFPKESDIYSKEIDKEFKAILDRMSKELINVTFENERLINALLKLSVIERIIIVFHIILGMTLTEISVLLNISPDNVYARKYRALNLLRKFMNN